MTTCPDCGIEAVDEATGVCAYCPDHKKRLAAEAKALAGETEAAIDTEDLPAVEPMAKPKAKGKGK